MNQSQSNHDKLESPGRVVVAVNVTAHNDSLHVGLLFIDRQCPQRQKLGDYWVQIPEYAVKLNRRQLIPEIRLDFAKSVTRM